MLDKKLAILSGVMTALLLMILGALSILFQMIAFNGVSESQGITAMSISLVGQVLTTALAAILAGWASNFLVAKFSWSKILAAILAIFAGTLLGAFASFLSIILAVSFAGIR